MKSVLLSAIFLGAAALAAQTAPTPADHPLARHYRDGETLTYRMTASNDDWHYTILATSVVQKNPDGVFMENVQWSGMTSNGQPITLAPGSADFRQPISLDTSRNPSGPNLSHVDPRLVGPITDLMTFYVDLWLANKIGIFQHAGDHFYVPNPQPSSWADGTRVLTGEDLIDFDVTLQSIDYPAAHTALLVVHHVPPPHGNLLACRCVDAGAGRGHAEQLGGGDEDTGSEISGRRRQRDLRRPTHRQHHRRQNPLGHHG